MPVCPKCREENPQLGARCPRDGYYFIPDDELEDALRDDMIGTLAADKYVILGMISEGGMGAVYRALQLPVEREVALKVLRTELQNSDQGRDRFILEARAVSRLNHPNIITLHDFGFDSKQHPYMVMEYAPGKSLARWLRDEVDLERIVHVMTQVLSALSEAHDRGIVHRDLKPENMIVTRAGSDRDYIKLLDFGIARMINEGGTRKLTREGEVFGTPHYMAPEQAQGKKNVGPPADVYACGIILWELLTGNCPYDAPTPLAVLFMHINEELPELVPRSGVTCPPEVKAVLERATRKDPLARYQHAGEMLAALDKAVENVISRSTLGSIQKQNPAEPKAERSRESNAPPQTKSRGFDRSKPMNLVSKAEADPPNDSIPVFDPDPSMERPAYGATPAKRTHDEKPEPRKTRELATSDEEGSARMKLGLIAVGILGIVVAIVASAFVFTNNESPAEAAENSETETSAATEPAVARKTTRPTPTAEPDEAKLEAAREKPEPAPSPEPTPTRVTDPKTVAGHAPPLIGERQPSDEPKPGDAASTEVAPESEPKKTVVKKRPTPKKSPAAEEEASPSTTAEKEEKKDEKEPVAEPKKFEPRPFEAPPPTKWKN